ncbi:ABC transporter ATP-binding protein [Hydrogenophaga sp. D2P1]|uniref:ABC transporter ATP-binding protein n=1 Tax=Hydrogenophaga aromaticivorans TaxID=2610898 RepID=A0A7Y8L0W3_9BURK|nr:ABC transporter ATP-binding protein [Hydrogenophaga aromaticivorans]NWF48796.1 ABC transporter ATP-binding protein [Hydrogenophaga aromaticivorans]
MLQVEQLDAHYGLFQALFGVSLRVEPGQTLALIGSNGAGKTTLLRTLAGALSARPDSICLDGQDISVGHELDRLRQGIALVPEGRRLFPSLTVREHLALAQRNGRPGAWTPERVLDEMPVLRDLLARPATAMSGGQQQLVAIARALLCNPRYLLCDEVSLGLSPLAVEEVYRLLRQASQSGMALVLVEQNVRRALNASDRYVCLQKGRVVLEGESLQANHHDVAAAYFGVETT